MSDSGVGVAVVFFRGLSLGLGRTSTGSGLSLRLDGLIIVLDLFVFDPGQSRPSQQ